MNDQPIQRIDDPQFLPQFPCQLAFTGVSLGLELELLDDVAEIVVVVVLVVRDELLDLSLGGLE
jgi:hypothetical protein